MTQLEYVQQFQKMQDYLRANLRQLDDASLALFYEMTRRFSYVGDEVREEMRYRCTTQGSICGWRLVIQRGAREIRNPDLAYNALQDVLSREEVYGCNSMSISKLQQLYLRRCREKDPYLNEENVIQSFLATIKPLITYKPDIQTFRR